MGEDAPGIIPDGNYVLEVAAVQRRGDDPTVPKEGLRIQIFTIEDGPSLSTVTGSPKVFVISRCLSEDCAQELMEIVSEYRGMSVLNGRAELLDRISAILQKLGVPGAIAEEEAVRLITANLLVIDSEEVEASSS